MKEVGLISILVWILAINIGRLFPISKGERYYQNLQKWYLLANMGKWEEAGGLENKIVMEDIEEYKKQNKVEELKKRLNEITIKREKKSDDWMELAVLFYKLNERDRAFKAIENAYKLDPIREDISKIYFTYQTSFLQPRKLP